MCSALGMSERMFQLFDFMVDNQIRDSIGILPIRQTIYGQDSTSLEAYDVYNKIIDLLNVVREVNKQFSTIQSERWTEENLAAYLFASSRLRRKLSSLAKNITDHDRIHPKYYQYKCCWLAAQIYVEAIYSPHSLATSSTDSYVRELKVALQRANRPNDWNPIPEAFIWVCLVGGAAAKNQTERGWMVAHLGPTMMSMGVLYFEDLIISIRLFAQIFKNV
jgi:hypothetical protein